MKDTVAQLVISAIGIGLVVCVATFALVAAYSLGRLAWDLWARHAVSSRRRPVATSPHLVDVEAEGWLEPVEWPFPGRRVEATAPDQTGEMTLPRLEVVA